MGIWSELASGTERMFGGGVAFATSMGCGVGVGVGVAAVSGVVFEASASGLTGFGLKSGEAVFGGGSADSSGLPRLTSLLVSCVNGMLSRPSSVGSGSSPVPRLRLPATLSRQLSSSACFDVFFFRARPSTSMYSRCFSGGSCAKSFSSNCASFSGSFDGVGVATIFGGGVGV